MSIDKRNVGAEHYGENSQQFRENLAREIAVEFQISFEQSKELISSESIQSRFELQKDFAHLDDSRLEDLINKIERAKHNISALSKNEISSLRNEVSSTETEICDTSTLEKTFGAERIHDAMNPQNIFHHIDGGVMGIGNACINTTKVMTNIGKGIIKTPYDLYLLGSGKAELPEYNV